MIMKIIKCYSVQVWDGADRHYHKYYVTSKEEADKHMTANKYDYVTPQTLVIYDSYEEYLSSKKGELHKQAMSKLTEEEKHVLGLTD